MRIPSRRWLKSVLAAWGGLTETDDAVQGSGRTLRVVLVVDGKRLHVGTLTRDEGQYVFRYSREFKDQTAIPPISAFPDVGHEYRESTLWPFFRVRLPPTERKDVQQVITDRGLDQRDVIQLLGEIGRRSITTPYELELQPSGT